MTARTAVTLHQLSGGRFMLGIGTGWLREEFDALGVPFADRGHIQDECLEVLKAALAGGPISHHGKYFTFDAVQVSPDPVAVPLVLGGNTDRALTRAARLADAWFASGTPSFEEAVRLRDRLAEICDRSGRGTPLPAYFRVPGADPRSVERYQAEGIENLLFWAQHLCPLDAERADDIRQPLQDAAAAMGL